MDKKKYPMSQGKQQLYNRFKTESDQILLSWERLYMVAL